MPALYDRAMEALEQGHGAEAASLLVRAMRTPNLRLDEQIRIRCALAEAWLLQDDLRQATDALGRPPDGRERAEPARLSDLWRLHGRLAVARGEPSRGIAFLTKALRFAERGHDSRAIGLSHYELALCYRQVGDMAIVREHLTAAASALHAAGDRRYLAMVHSLSGVVLAQDGRLDEALVAMRHAERLAAAAGAGDVLATVCGNQANVALMHHRHDEALALAERSVALQEESGTPHGLAIALASLGQIHVRVGNLDRAEEALNRALDVRSPLQFMRETTGAVFDTLAQIHLIRGDHREAGRAVARAREAYGEYGTQTSQWYEWSLRVLDARIALRRGDAAGALARAGELLATPGVPPGYAIQAELIAVEALLASGDRDEAQRRLHDVAARIEPRGMTGPWGECLRLRGRLHALDDRPGDAYHDFAQSVSVFELLGERYQAGLSYLEAGRVAARAGAHVRARRFLGDAARRFEALRAAPELQETRALATTIPTADPGGPRVDVDGDDVLVRRIVDAAAIPALLAREGAAALVEACRVERAVLFVHGAGRSPRVLAAAGSGTTPPETLAALVGHDTPHEPLEAIGREADGVRYAWLSSAGPIPADAVRRFRMLCAVLRQGFELCGARERPPEAAGQKTERPLEPLLPASSAPVGHATGRRTDSAAPGQ
jgi:tetratricopeptide (TPR) repeat protein